MRSIQQASLKTKFKGAGDVAQHSLGSILKINKPANKQTAMFPCGCIVKAWLPTALPWGRRGPTIVS